MISPFLPVYRRSDLTMIRGEGAYLYAEDGRRYLDFATGIAVNALGHCHPAVTTALKAQADTLWHCSNLYRIPGLERLAERFVEASFADSVFFCNSGAEAVECGIKMVRKYHHANGQPERYRIVTMQGGFHGRTLATTFAGGTEKSREGFGPPVDGFDTVTLNDIDAVRGAITERTGAVLVEAIQGEGGIRSADIQYLQALRALCDERGVLLFMDEVQCGMGRTGKLFAYEWAGIAPDIVSVAKGIGNGFPLAACLSVEKVARCMTQGSHGSTYGSNPLAMAVGNAVLDAMLEQDFLPRVQAMGEQLKAALQSLADRFPHLIDEVRGRGLMLGLKMKIDHYAFAATLRDAGLLTSPTVSDRVIRIVPPLIIEESHIEEAVALLCKVCGSWNQP